ncbi:gamma-glutamyl-gamma-aminobutyrate hydrolase family protein [Nitrosopumilus sp. K4]|uniref:type 1 glutamine amidotransferase n=1 Tax=Nitrosopumilus sp. K4 TaxID=2795383 RepID=UPI001BAB3BBF|nr:gamma-glutamyl-gamma-aminobutyrate hydrolase family protein [Nitrosopumilus sp. K4]QUC64502.1 gamma-glutamyl-gamma-aminobutyrate hydrolase family protein [Nitrosopumilus sp. K4]
MLLVVDNGSVYTKNLTDFLNEKTINFEKYTPFEIDLENFEKYDSFILSGRRKNEKKINEINSKIIKHSIETKKKLLGICYGAEILALTLGGTIRKTNSLQKGKETIKFLKKNPIYDNDIEVFESHNFEIAKLPNSLVSIGRSKTCKNEIIQHENNKIFGTQFHPEMSLDGKNIIENFCNL